MRLICFVLRLYWQQWTLSALSIYPVGTQTSSCSTDPRMGTSNRARSCCPRSMVHVRRCIHSSRRAPQPHTRRPNALYSYLKIIFPSSLAIWTSHIPTHRSISSSCPRKSGAETNSFDLLPESLEAGSRSDVWIRRR